MGIGPQASATGANSIVLGQNIVNAVPGTVYIGTNGFILYTLNAQTTGGWTYNTQTSSPGAGPPYTITAAQLTTGVLNFGDPGSATTGTLPDGTTLQNSFTYPLGIQQGFSFDVIWASTTHAVTPLTNTGLTLYGTEKLTSSSTCIRLTFQVTGAGTWDVYIQ